MRIVLDPVPLVLGIYAYVGELLSRTAEKREDDAAEALGRRLSRQRAAAGDREAQRMVRTLHTDVKTADKLLKKTSDVWKISQETDLVDLVILPRGEEPPPKAYVLLRPKEIRPLSSPSAPPPRAPARATRHWRSSTRRSRASMASRTTT
jgi:hypothetical protein